MNNHLPVNSWALHQNVMTDRQLLHQCWWTSLLQLCLLFQTFEGKESFAARGFEAVITSVLSVRRHVTGPNEWLLISKHLQIQLRSNETAAGVITRSECTLCISLSHDLNFFFVHAEWWGLFSTLSTKNNNNANLSLGTCKHYCLWLSIKLSIFTAPAWGCEVKSWIWSPKTTTSCFSPSHAYIWSNGLWMWSWQSIMFLFLFFECGLLGLM